MKSTLWASKFGGGVGSYPVCIPNEHDFQIRKEKMHSSGIGLNPKKLTERLDVLFNRLKRINAYENADVIDQVDLIELIGAAFDSGMQWEFEQRNH